MVTRTTTVFPFLCVGELSAVSRTLQICDWRDSYLDFLPFPVLGEMGEQQYSVGATGSYNMFF